MSANFSGDQNIQGREIPGRAKDSYLKGKWEGLGKDIAEEAGSQAQ
jgi:hypothetical protein